MHTLQPAWIMFSLILTLNLLHNGYREGHSNGAFVSSRSSLSPSRFSATFIMSLEMWCYEQSLGKKEKGLCNNVLPSTRISKALTSLQWPHVARKPDHPKNNEAHSSGVFFCGVSLIPEEVAQMMCLNASYGSCHRAGGRERLHRCCYRCVLQISNVQFLIHLGGLLGTSALRNPS